MTDTDRPQPHDDLAERALLGAILTNPETAEMADQQLGAGAFHQPIHTAIYTAIIARTSRAQPVDAILIAQDLAKTGQLNKLPGGATYLHTCIAACPDPTHAGHYTRIIADHANRRALLNLAERLARTAAVEDTQTRIQLLDDIRHSLDAAAAPGNKLNGSRIRLTRASSFAIKPVRWVWADRMPVGEICLIPGREGVGKSTFLAWMAAAVTNGNLPGIHNKHPRAVLYAANEDAWDYTIAPRMKAAGANLDLIYRIDTLTDTGPAGLILPRDCRYLPDVAQQVDAAILMCDPLLSLLDETISTFKAQELRQALEPLRRVAEEARLAVPALVHFNKGQSGDINTLISGSRAFSEVARSVIAIVQDKEADDYTCVVTQTKNNLGRLDATSLAYTIDSVTLETDEGDDAHVGRLRWIGEVDVTADELLSGDTTDRPLSEKTQAIVDFVIEAGPVSVQEVADHFKTSIKYATVRQALTRCAKRGDLVSPSRGIYESPKTRKHGRNSQAEPPTTHTTSQASQESPPQVNKGNKRESGVSPGVTSDTQKKSDTSDTSDSDTGIARAREKKIHTCLFCHTPISADETNSHHCPTFDEPVEEREWYP